MKEGLQRVIGQNLCRIRNERHLTREQLAEQVGISTTFYANLECGNKMMSLVTLRKIADVLCVSTDSILYEDKANKRIKNIEVILRDQPEALVSFVERIVRLCVNSLPDAEIIEYSHKSQDVKEQSTDECRV